MGLPLQGPPDDGEGDPEIAAAQRQLGCGADSHDARQASQLSYAVPYQARHARRGPETLIPQGCLQRQNSIQAEARIDGPQRDECLREQAGAREQDQDQGDLSGNETPARTRSPEACRRRSGTCGQRLVHTGSRYPHGGADSDEDARAGRSQHREGSKPPVQCQGGRVVAEPRQVHRIEGEERTRAGQTENEAAEAAGRRQQETLDRELTKQLCAGGAQGCPDGDLAAAPDSANGEKVRDVRARDEKKEPDGGDNQQERGTVAANHDLLQRFRPDSDGGFRTEHAREPSSELRGQRLERRVGRSQRRGRVEAARHAEQGNVRAAVGFDLQGQPDVGDEAEDADIEFSSQDPDHQSRDAID